MNWRQTAEDYAWITYLGLSGRISTRISAQDLRDVAVGSALGVFAITTATRQSLWAAGILLVLSATALPKAFHPGPTIWLACRIALLCLSSIGALYAVEFRPDEAGVSIAIAMWVSIMVLMTCVRLTEKVFALVLPIFCVPAVVALVQGVLLHGRAAGLTANANVGAGFLVLGALYLATTRYKYWALVLIAAMPFTGSRLAAGVFLALVPLLGWRYSWKWALAALATLATITITFHSIVLPALGFPERITVSVIHTDISRRLTAPPALSQPGMALSTSRFLPRGYAGDVGFHNVPLRLLYETGLTGSAIWIFLSGYGLTRRLWTPA